MDLFRLQQLAAKNSDPSDCFDTEEAFGDGMFQIRFLVLTSVAVLLMTCIADVVPVISSQDVDHWCKPPSYSNISYSVWKYAIPVGADGQRSRCHVFNRPYGSIGSKEVTACHEWDFDKRNAPASVISAWSAVCDQRARQLLVPMASQQVGSFLFLLLAAVPLDMFGRVRVLKAAALTTVVSAPVGLAVSHHCVRYAWAQVLLSGCVAVCAAAAMLVAFEVLVHRRRPKCLIYATALSCVLAELWILVVRNMSVFWETKHVALLLPAFLVVTAATFMGEQESPRWLIARDVVGKAERVILAAGETNYFVLEAGLADFFDKLKYRACSIANHGDRSAAATISSRQSSSLDAARLIRRRALLMFFVQFSLAYAVHLNTVFWVARGEHDSGVTWWLPAILVYFVSLLGNVVALLAVARMSLESALVALTAVVTGVHCVASYFFGFYTAADRGLLAFSGGLANVAIVVGSCYVMEDVPTPVRGVALCWSLASGRVGALLACVMPLLLKIDDIYWAFAVSSLFLGASLVMAWRNMSPLRSEEVVGERNLGSALKTDVSSLRASLSPSRRSLCDDSVRGEST
ncbi:hypothetical protein HPB50_005715 [Hyalomma asiaticum]|uniref:Uncharacterized protein n=1 Tax=Hyalomma asiaticum TaxID=266040 RepID=A0ACB7RUI5_HYAAI|nr:hypothetical protein HPB50_005715 [Hyalomma asiaticum]